MNHIYIYNFCKFICELMDLEKLAENADLCFLAIFIHSKETANFPTKNLLFFPIAIENNNTTLY